MNEKKLIDLKFLISNFHPEDDKNPSYPKFSKFHILINPGRNALVELIN